MTDFLAELVELDAAGDHDKLALFIRQNDPDTSRSSFAICQLLVTLRLQIAYNISKILQFSGVRHPAIALSLSIGGLLSRNSTDEMTGYCSLHEQMSALPAEQVQAFFIFVIKPVFGIMAEQLYKAGDQRIIAGFMEICMAAVPQLRPRFALPFQQNLPDIADIRRRGRERSRLVSLTQPPLGTPRVNRRAVVAMREFFFPRDPNTRPCEMGPRICAAMRHYGWNTAFYGMSYSDFDKDFAGIVELCLRENAELLVLDDQLVEDVSLHDRRAAMISDLREQLPSLKVIAFEPDPWDVNPDYLRQAAVQVDAVWTSLCALPVWTDPAFANKILQLPLPHAGNFSPALAPLQSGMTFVGGVNSVNWTRALWLGAAKRLGLPIEPQISNHQGDGLSALDSYAAYMRKLTESNCSVNFSARGDLSRVLTGRSFEVVLSGALLVHEMTEDLDYFFISGDHYLEFDNLAELMTIVKFISDHPEEAESVRVAGNDFARKNYNDNILIGHIDQRLFHPQV
jgi:hypothetical protein